MRNAYILPLLALLLGLSGCASLPNEVHRTASSHTDRDGESSRIASRATPYLRKHPGKSGFWLLGDGLDAFAARVLLAEAADRTIDVQYYLYHNDVTGRILTYRLLRAADRGVRVRLLLDDMTTKGIDTPLATLDAHPNIEVRIVNPYANRGFRGLETLTRFDAVTRRMHNKSFTVDNLITVVGGRNIGDEYFGTHENVNFGDLDVLALGPVASEVGQQFDLYWNSDIVYPIATLAREAGDLEELRGELAAFDEAQRASPYVQRLHSSELVKDFIAGRIDFQWGQALVFYDLPQKLTSDPDDRSTHMAPRLLPATLGSLERDLLIFSPYFVPGKHGVVILTDLEKRGVQVRILTNSLASTDVGVVHAGYAKYRKPLLQGGVEIYEFKPDADQSDEGQIRQARKIIRRQPARQDIGLRSTKLFLSDPRIWIRAPGSSTRSSASFSRASPWQRDSRTGSTLTRLASPTASVSITATARKNLHARGSFDGTTRAAAGRWSI